MRSRLFSLVALLFISSTLYAQSDAQVRYKEAPARYQIYGGYSFLSNSLNGVPGFEQGINGFNAGFAIPPWHSLRFKVDFSREFILRIEQRLRQINLRKHRFASHFQQSRENRSGLFVGGVRRQQQHGPPRTDHRQDRRNQPITPLGNPKGTTDTSWDNKGSAA